MHRRLFDKDGRFTVVHRYVTSADSGVLLLEAALRLPASDKDWRRKVAAAYRRLEVDYPSSSWADKGLQVRPVVFFFASPTPRPLTSDSRERVRAPQVLVTANVILAKQDPVREDRSTYSVFYGQAFEDGQESSGRASKSGRLDEDALRGRSADNDDNEGDEPDATRQAGTLLYDRLHAKTPRQLRQGLPRRLEPDYIIERFQSAISEDSQVSVHAVINHVFLFFKLVQLGGSTAATSFGRLRDEPGYAFPRVGSVPE